VGTEQSEEENGPSEDPLAQPGALGEPTNKKKTTVNTLTGDDEDPLPSPGSLPKEVPLAGTGPSGEQKWLPEEEKPGLLAQPEALLEDGPSEEAKGTSEVPLSPPEEKKEPSEVPSQPGSFARTGELAEAMPLAQTGPSKEEKGPSEEGSAQGNIDL
jgi:hypothetical protein